MPKHRIIIEGEGLKTVIAGRKHVIRFRIPPAEPGGKPRWSKQITFKGSIGEARRRAEEYRQELEEELNNEHSGLTVGQYARDFQEQRKALGTLSPLTIKRDENEIAQIERFFGSFLLADLSVGDINKVYSKMRTRHKMSPSAIHKVHAKLRQVMNRAVKEELILRNPCNAVDDVKRPKAQERRSLSLEQAMELAQVLKSESRSGNIVAVWLALATGLRRGEALALTWADIDLQGGRLKISRQYDSNREHRSPKSQSSIRNISIDEGTVEFLKEWKQMQSEEFYKGKDVPNAFPVCTNELGEYMDPNIFGRWRRSFFADNGLGSFKNEEHFTDSRGRKRIRRSGYEGFTFHELRHTQATLLIGSGVDIRTVQDRLGHSSASLTMNIYSHVIEQNDRNAADTIGDTIFGNKSELKEKR